MPTYSHICTDETCSHEWEDVYSIKKDPPKICPRCNKETAQRTISLSSKGIVELHGQDFVDKTMEDGRKFKEEVYKSEKLYANILGEDRYQRIQTKLDRRGR